EDPIVDGVRRDLAKEAVVEGCVPCSARLIPHPPRKRDVVHGAFLARSTNRVARSSSTGFHQHPPTFNALATMTPSTMERMSPTLSGSTPLPTSVGSEAAARISLR